MDYIAQANNISVKKSKFCSKYGEGFIGGEKVILQKPETFMNNSGEAISALANFYKLSPEEVIIICDDISLPVGKIRIRTKGSAGGHNGIKSIINHLKTQDFARIKIGVGNPENPEADLANYVLGDFPKKEQEAMFESFKRTNLALVEYIKSGAQAAMNKYNG